MAKYELQDVQKFEDISLAHINLAVQVTSILNTRVEESQGKDERAVRLLTYILEEINASYL